MPSRTFMSLRLAAVARKLAIGVALVLVVFVVVLTSMAVGEGRLPDWLLIRPLPTVESTATQPDDESTAIGLAAESPDAAATSSTVTHIPGESSTDRNSAETPDNDGDAVDVAMNHAHEEDSQGRSGGYGYASLSVVESQTSSDSASTQLTPAIPTATATTAALPTASPTSRPAASAVEAEPTVCMDARPCAPTKPQSTAIDPTNGLPTPTTTAPAPPPASVRPDAETLPPSDKPAVAQSVPVLMYHYVRINPDPKDRIGYGLSVTPSDFKAQMALLSEMGYRSLTVGEVIQAKPLESRTIAITFDDGYEDFYTAAYPVLRQYGFRATVYVITDLVGKPGYLTWDQIRELASNGVEIGSHTVDHPDLTAIGAEKLAFELEQSRAELEKETGMPVLDFCYPSGRLDDRVVTAVRKAGYRSAVTTLGGIHESGQDPFRIRRVRVYGGMSAGTLASAIGQ